MVGLCLNMKVLRMDIKNPPFTSFRIHPSLPLWVGYGWKWVCFVIFMFCNYRFGGECWSDSYLVHPALRPDSGRNVRTGPAYI